MQAQPIEFISDKVRRAGHEAGAHPEGLGAQPQIQACRLDLITIKLALTLKTPRFKQRGNCAVGQNSSFASHHAPSIISRRQNQSRGIDASAERQYCKFIPW